MSSISVFVKLSNSQQISMTVDLEMTTDEFFKMVAQKSGIANTGQTRFNVSARQLQPGHKLKEYGLENGSEITQMLRIRG